MIKDIDSNQECYNHFLNAVKESGVCISKLSTDEDEDEYVSIRVFSERWITGGYRSSIYTGVDPEGDDCYSSIEEPIYDGCTYIPEEEPPFHNLDIILKYVAPNMSNSLRDNLVKDVVEYSKYRSYNEYEHDPKNYIVYKSKSVAMDKLWQWLIDNGIILAN